MDCNEMVGRSCRSATTRRRMVQGLAATTLIAASLPLTSRAVSSTQATYFGWTGYDVPAFYANYIEKNGDSPAFVLYSDESEAYIKLQAGFKPDVAHPCFHNITRWREAGLLQPIDTSRLTNWPDVIPELRDLPGAVHDGQRYFLPWEYGNVSILYRPDLVDVKENSLGLLWDERYKGRISVLDIGEDAVALTAMYAGFDPFQMTPDQMAKVRELLDQQRPLVKFYSSDLALIEQALASGELVAAMGFNASATTLKAQGVPIEFMDPVEGRLTAVCGLVLIKDAPQVDRAYDLLDAMISPESGARLIADLGYGHSNAKAYGLVGESRLQELALNSNPAEFLKKGVFLDDYHNHDEVIRMFEAVKAGL